MTDEKINKKLSFPKMAFLIIGILLIIALLAAGAYFYLQYRKTQDLLKNPTMAAQIESKDLVTKVGMLMELPKDEQPTIATVSDVSKLKDQPFFAKAKNGYKVLIYSKAQKAILYDPLSNKIIEVGPINVTQSNETVNKKQPVRLVLYNGSNVVGLTKTVEKQLQEKIANIFVIDKQNAAKSDYTKTLVIDLTNKQKVLAAKIATLLQGSVASLPAEEVKPPQADILVIVTK